MDQAMKRYNRMQGSVSPVKPRRQRVMSDRSEYSEYTYSDNSDDEEKDKVAIAFAKFDTDGDGYLSWEEFKMMTKTMGEEQQQRFFQSGDVTGDGRISLEEFRRMSDKQQAK